MFGHGAGIAARSLGAKSRGDAGRIAFRHRFRPFRNAAAGALWVHSGFRANHLDIAPNGPDDLRFEAIVAATEITGSESFLHLDHGGDRWIALVHGVHLHPAGAALTAYLDPAHIYVFAQSGALVSAAPYAQAA